MRLTMRSSVVLPQPDEPTKTVVECDGMTRLKSPTAVVPSANVLETRSILDHEVPLRGSTKRPTSVGPLTRSSPASATPRCRR